MAVAGGVGVTTGSARGVALRAAAAGCACGGDFCGGACCVVAAATGFAPLAGALPRGSMRAAILPFCVNTTTKVPSGDEYSNRTLPAASSACGWFCGAISRTSVRICALVSACFITGRGESLIVTVATSPSVSSSAEALLVTNRLRKRSSCAMSVQWTNAIDQRTIDQPRVVGCIECQEPRFQRVEIIEHARAVRAHLQANRAKSNLAANRSEERRVGKEWRAGRPWESYK